MNRIRIILAENTTLHEMLLGIVVSNLLLSIIAMIFSENRMDSCLGVLVGTIVAIIYCIHMAVTIDDALCLDEKGASQQMRKHMLIRYFFVCVVVAAACIFKTGNPIFIILSCITVKMGAYMQPLIHKILKRSKESGDAVNSDSKTLQESENGGKISE